MGEVVKSADRTLAILDLLTEHRDGLTLIDIHRHLRFPKSSTYGLLLTMVSRGFLEQEAESRRFRVGIRLWQAGQTYAPATDLEQVALPFMERLRDLLSQTVQLATLDGVDNVYIAKAEPDQHLRLASRVGVRLPAYATGIGKALLSQLEDDDIRARFANVDFVRYTPRTITSLEQLIATIQEARSRGYATDNAEYTPGVYCVAAAVIVPRGAVRAAVSVSAPGAQRGHWPPARIIDAVQDTANQISLRMGYQADHQRR